MYSSKKVVFNTGILYAKTLITILISLYSTRLVLNALGVRDYGLYNLIGGIIAMLSFLKASMSSSTQRFLSYNRGTGNLQSLTRVFSSSVVLHLILGVVIVIGLEAIGLPFLQGALKIPSDRLGVAKIVFHLMVGSTFLTINSVPYEGVLNANEDMLAMSVIGIGESVLKLLLSVSLFYIKVDLLIYYSLAMLVITFLVRTASLWYCRRNYEECRGGLKLADKKEIKEMFSFALWNSFGALCSLGRSQGTAVVLNMFFGVVVNAAYGIANQVSSQLNFFSQSMIMSLRPQIIKSEGAGDRDRMLRLSLIASKFSFYLLALCAIPVIVELPFILKIWLKSVPESTVSYCRWIIILSLVIQLSVGVMIAVQSIGRIRQYQSIVGSFILLSLPLGYIFFKLDFPSETILIITVLVEVVATVLRLIFAKSIVGLPIMDFAKEVLVKGIVPAFIAFAFSVLVHMVIMNDWIRLFTVCVVSCLSFALGIYFLGLNSVEKDMVENMVARINKKISLKKANI